eukprot:5087487-Pyramimonas_sp.AAC.1
MGIVPFLWSEPVFPIVRRGTGRAVCQVTRHRKPGLRGVWRPLSIQRGLRVSPCTVPLPTT